MPTPTRPSRAALLLGALLTTAALLTGVAVADNQAVLDPSRDTPALKKKPQLDIVRASAGHAVGGKIKHKVTMRGKLTPKAKNTRPFILINTRGGDSSRFEYVVLGPRVLEVKGKRYIRAGANKFSARKRTWVYRFDPKSIGNPKSYGWAALTSKGKAVDLAPNQRYKTHELRP